MHIHDVVTCYNSCPFLCAWHVNITVFFALPPCCVDESYSHVRMCSKVVLVDDHVNFDYRRDEVNLLFALLFPPMSESVSYISSPVSCLTATV